MAGEGVAVEWLFFALLIGVVPGPPPGFQGTVAEVAFAYVGAALSLSGCPGSHRRHAPEGDSPRHHRP